MRLSACLFSVLVIATPVAAQDYDPWSDSWEWPSYVEPPSARDYNDNPALDQALDRLDAQERRSRSAWEAAERRQRFNDRTRCSLSNNEAWQQRCFEGLGW